LLQKICVAVAALTTGGADRTKDFPHGQSKMFYHSPEKLNKRDIGEAANAKNLDVITTTIAYYVIPVKWCDSANLNSTT